jgi:hypothetical protein
MLNDPNERRRDQARRFLAALYGDCPAGHLVLWLPRRRLALWPADLDAASGEAVRLAARDVLALPALWADLTVVGPSGRHHDLPPDQATRLAILRDFPLPPSALVRTNRGHQAYWFLDEPFENSDLAATRALLHGLGGTLAAIARRHGWRIDEHVFTPAGALALPGTLDRSQRRPRLVRLEALDAERRYPVAGLRLASAVTFGVVSR